LFNSKVKGRKLWFNTPLTFLDASGKALSNLTKQCLTPYRRTST